MKKEKDMIEIFYCSEENALEEVLKKESKKLQEQLSPINLEQLCKENSTAQELVNKLEENYHIKMSAYNKAMYKQGFIDGVNLMINCLEK